MTAARRWSLVDEGAFVRPRAPRSESLYEFIPRVTPGFTAPHHLDPVVQALNRAMHEPVRVVISTPPRHTKTFTILHWIMWVLLYAPETYIAYVTFNKARANEVSRDALAIAERAGVRFANTNLSVWRASNGSKVMWGGLGGTWTGHGFHIIVVDDPIKNRAEAESPIVRDSTDSAIRSVVFSRQEPGARGVSLIVNMARWHTDDPAGRLIRDGWPCVNLKAIDANGKALWPEGFSVEKLREIESTMGPYEFGALYQGEPRQKGATVFGEPNLYDALPSGDGYQVSGGLDFAYTVRTWSDFSVFVVLRYYAGKAYVVDCVRERVEAPGFKSRVLPVATRHGLNRNEKRPGIQAYIGGTEKGVLDFMKAPDGTAPLFITQINAGSVGDKFARAQPVAGAWNAGRVLLPKNVGALRSLGSPYREMAEKNAEAPVPWVAAMIDEVCGFTGIADAHDDIVDAMAGAFVPFVAPPTPPPARGVINRPIFSM
jgi:phage terminase large subunit-like protein